MTLYYCGGSTKAVIYCLASLRINNQRFAICLKEVRLFGVKAILPQVKMDKKKRHFDTVLVTLWVSTTSLSTALKRLPSLCRNEVDICVFIPSKNNNSRSIFRTKLSKGVLMDVHQICVSVTNVDKERSCLIIGGPDFCFEVWLGLKVKRWG